MSVADLVSNLRQLDIRLSAEGERLRVNAPKGVLTESLRAQLAERKQELLDFLRDNSAPTLKIPPIVRRMDAGPSPLSFTQERIWFLEQLESAGAVYNICRAWRLLGKLSVSAIESSLNEIVRRHHVLRSSFRVDGGRPVQVVRPPFELNLSVVDLQGTSNSEREQKIRDRIQQVADTPFDFAAGKFLRAELLRIADYEYVLILATHHIVSDAWSMGILTRELWSLYETYATDKPSQLEELQIQYADFAAWQREWLHGDALEGQLSYWKEQLKDLIHLNLPTDRPRPARQSFEAARIPIRLPETLTAAIHELSNQAGVTPFMILLAAFQVLLYRYSGQEEIVVGSPMANRARTELEPLIGFFVSTLVLRSDLSGNPVFNELLARVREVCLGAYAYQDVSFEKLVQELQPERDPSRNPLFQVMFALQNATRPFVGVPGLRIEPIEREKTRSQFDLSLFLRERDSKYIGYFEYSMDLFDRDRIERMATHYRTLLGAVVANPDQPIATVPILTEAERHKILVEWNDTAADYPKDKCIHELFEAQVERTPKAIAVQFEEKQLTYRELNSQANQLAYYLQRLGVGPERLVGICVERSLEMVVGLFGILKAGGAYLPLDPAYPRERMAFMLKDAQCSVLLTEQRFVEDARCKTEDGDPPSSILDPQMKVVCLDTDSEIIASESEQNPCSEVKPCDVAYVIYTSGSTGSPKSVEVLHRSLVNCLHAMAQRLEFSDRDVLLAVTTISFDIAALELYLPLLVGGRVFVARLEDAKDGRELVSRLTECSATAMQATPFTWRLLLDAGWKGRRAFKILCGGETLSRELAERLLERGMLWNLYGPTETTIWSTIHRVKPGDGPVYIGRPIANTQIYILDAHLQPLPIGVHGDLYIGGDGLARGYMPREDLTSERFVRNPTGDDPEARLYRTGDRARYRPDGNIEFLGRLDTQVKIRGHRVELEEIEAVLNQHPALRESAVTVRNRGSSGEKDLIGYFVPKGISPVEISGLRSFLCEKLPAYMVPSLFVKVEALPLSPNGKMDRAALGSSNDTRPELSEAYVEPRTQVEELLAQIWEEVLEIELVGIHDNFFELGGHSLLAIQIISRVREAFDKDVPLSALFDAPTVAALAATIEKTISRRSNDLPPITRAPRDGPLPLSMNQEHLWRLDRMIPGKHFFNIPYVYRLSGELNIGALEQASKEIVRRHEALRTVFSSSEETPFQIVNPIGNFQLSVVDLRLLNSDVRSHEAARVIVDERTQGFDLEKGPLLRIQLVRLTASESLLLITLHHIISDHSSVRRIREELVRLYAAFCRKEESPLSEPQIQFADYAVWERKLLHEGVLNQQISYWREQLSRPSTGISLQKHKPNGGFYFCRERIEFDEDLFRKVRAFACAGAYTPFMMMIAALSAVIHCQTNQRAVRIGTIVANRGKPDTEVLIGHLSNTVVLMLDISSDMTLEDLLTHTRRVVLLAFTHQQLPFEYLAQTLEPQDALLFETFLVYQRNSLQQAEALGLRFAPFEIDQERVEAEVVLSRVPLILRLRETSTTLTGTVNYKIDSFGYTDMVKIRKGTEVVLRKIVSESITNVSVGSLVSFV